MRKSQIFDSSDTCPIVWSCFKILVFYSKHLTLWYFSLEEIDSGYLRFWIYHWDMPLEQTLEIIDVSLKKCFYLISHFIKSWVPFSLTASMFDLKKKKKKESWTYWPFLCSACWKRNRNSQWAWSDHFDNFRQYWISSCGTLLTSNCYHNE